MTSDPVLDEDAFRALARSSPWRWRTLHLCHRDLEDRPGRGEVEAWIRRPGRMRVLADGTSHDVEEGPDDGVGFSSVGGRAPAWEARWAGDLSPVLRPDGLVAELPREDTGTVYTFVQYDDPMWQDYRWVAMLHPLELSHHVDLTDLDDAELRGRRTWTARVVPREGYDPRCGCCPLLWSEISERDEAAAGGPVWRDTDPDLVYPDAYRVSLDVRTGVVVDLAPIGGDRAYGFRNEILDVDDPSTDPLGDPSRRTVRS